VVVAVPLALLLLLWKTAARPGARQSARDRPRSPRSAHAGIRRTTRPRPRSHPRPSPPPRRPAAVAAAAAAVAFAHAAQSPTRTSRQRPHSPLAARGASAARPLLLHLRLLVAVRVLVRRAAGPRPARRRGPSPAPPSPTQADGRPGPPHGRFPPENGRDGVEGGWRCARRRGGRATCLSHGRRVASRGGDDALRSVRLCRSDTYVAHPTYSHPHTHTYTAASNVRGPPPLRTRTALLSGGPDQAST
jgi:hypothetical protein